MSKFLLPAITLALLLTIGGGVRAQTVAMSGEYGESLDRAHLFHAPMNPPLMPCTNTQSARCHGGAKNGVPDRLLAPSSGVPVAGAGVVIIPGDRETGAAFTIPPLVFAQPAVHKYRPERYNFAVVQVDTTLSLAMPRFERKVNPQSGTRMFRANAWSQPGNGQTGRGAAHTTPISTGTQTTHDITLKYFAGVNAFGGTMANLLDGERRLYIAQSAYCIPCVAEESRAAIYSRSFGDGIRGNFETENGAGWGYTRMGVQQAGILRNFQVIAPPCTQEFPPAPAGCGLISDFEGHGFTVRTTPGATSTKFMYAWTTGTVSVLLAGTLGGFPNDQLLTGMGYDTTSMTAGGTVRNIGMVAGSYTRRNFEGYSDNGQEIIGIDLTFTPEPEATVALVAGLGLLTFLSIRRREGSWTTPYRRSP